MFSPGRFCANFASMGTPATPQTATAKDPRYPIGKFQMPAELTPALRASAIATISELPENLRNAVAGLSTEQNNTPYREGGWTVRQLVHHIADSHAHASSRLRFALTEDWPTVFGYNEKLWAELHDSMTAPVEWSLEMIEATHARWVMLLQSLDDAQWQRGFKHSERGPSTIDQVTQLYAWHCIHHTAHLTHLRQKMGW